MQAGARREGIGDGVRGEAALEEGKTWEEGEARGEERVEGVAGVELHGEGAVASSSPPSLPRSRLLPSPSYAAMLALLASRDPTASLGGGLPAAPRLVSTMDGGGELLLVQRSMGRRAVARRQTPGRWRGQGRGRGDDAPTGRPVRAGEAAGGGWPVGSRSGTRRGG